MKVSTNDLKTPHKAARAAMWLLEVPYSRQPLGINDYYDQLAQAHKERCRRLVKEIEAAPAEKGSEDAKQD